MYILACEHRWLKEDTDIAKLQELRDNLANKREYRDKIFNISAGDLLRFSFSFFSQ